ncbi:methylamine utilization protein MauJ [Pseudohalocynthiibacter aestuariivivens]|uniref:Methylamine utilization protein MauJ n=1 Tax=Pseudohalocynthiibacter aestuariivivens TaxID=1591409 RepID=A0ABV5JEE8_9RHOB|nr:methylamine utilization protein MauJ [Pseudohalocynthiibacter aestuariivivens]MBS9717035.1 hypothetical protein [Pseudohalocynthiibacter aestuariivivens]
MTEIAALAAVLSYCSISKGLARYLVRREFGGKTSKIMLGLKVLEYKDALTDELKKPGRWIVAYVESSMAWPVRVQRIAYLGQEYWIIPVTIDAYPGIAVRVQGKDEDELREKILRFLSVLSWVEGKGSVLLSFGGGSALYPYKRSSNAGLVIRDQFDLCYLPEITEAKHQLALALMREGRGLSHIAYSFLSFYRVLEVAVGKTKIKEWVAQAVNRLPNGEGKRAWGKLIASGILNVSDHLYKSGRCAIAHAGSNPIVDPDKPTDSNRLYHELPLVEGLAELAIEENFNVQTAGKVFREHLYELSGFKRILGAEIVQSVVLGKPIGASKEIDVPVIDFQLKGKGPFEALKGLQPTSFVQDGNKVHVEFEREDGRLRVKFSLNFTEERLEFDIHDGFFGAQDDDSSTYAFHKAELTEFAKWYYLNGSIQIADSKTGELIARKDAFIPINVVVQPDEFDKDIEFWRSIAENRRKLEAAK